VTSVNFRVDRARVRLRVSARLPTTGVLPMLECRGVAFKNSYC